MRSGAVIPAGAEASQAAGAKGIHRGFEYPALTRREGMGSGSSRRLTGNRNRPRQRATQLKGTTAMSSVTNSMTARMDTSREAVRMSHRNDAHTSKEAAEKVATKKEWLYRSILGILADADLTPTEVLNVYEEDSHGLGWPIADLYDLRRRMSELQYDGRIEPIQVGTHRDGSPQYMTRNGQRVMRLVQS